MGAFVTRIGLLFSIAWIAQLTTPLFTVFGRGWAGRDLILLIGGLFLIGKAVLEIHEKIEPGAVDMQTAAARRVVASLMAVVAQIMVIDIVFSLDSVITAVGMVDEVEIMVAANVVALGVMLVAVTPVSDFVERHPTVKMLALAFLVLIGTNLVAEGFGQHIPKGYTYAAMAFSVLVEMLNLRVRQQLVPAGAAGRRSGVGSGDQPGAVAGTAAREDGARPPTGTAEVRSRAVDSAQRTVLQRVAWIAPRLARGGPHRAPPRGIRNPLEEHMARTVVRAVPASLGRSAFATGSVSNRPVAVAGPLPASVSLRLAAGAVLTALALLAPLPSVDAQPRRRRSARAWRCDHARTPAIWSRATGIDGPVGTSISTAQHADGRAPSCRSRWWPASRSRATWATPPATCGWACRCSAGSTWGATISGCTTPVSSSAACRAGGTGIAPFVQGGVGGMTNNVQASVISVQSTNLMYTAGVGVDVGMSRNLALRIQAKDYIGRFDSQEAIGIRSRGTLCAQLGVECRCQARLLAGRR